MLEIGKTYKTSDGKDVVIDRMNGRDPYSVDRFGFGPFVSEEFGLYHSDGRFASGDCPSLDIVSVDATPQTGTLKELDVKAGDVVEYIHSGTQYTVSEINQHLVHTDGISKHYSGWDTVYHFRIISRASDANTTPKTWGEMTDAEKGDLLLAWQRGETLQYWDSDGEEWRDTDIHPHEFDADAYRVKTAPDRETISLGWAEGLGVGNVFQDGDTHRITFDIIDGKPDCTTVKMEAVE